MLIRLYVAALLTILLSISADGQERPPNSTSAIQADSPDLKRIVDESEAAAKKGQFEDAIEGFKAVLAQADTSAGLRHRAVSGLVLAQNQLRKKRDGFWGTLSGLPMKYALPILLLVLFGIIRYVFPRPGTLISFSDFTVKPDEAFANSRRLTADVLNLLEHPEPVAVAGLQMNTMPGTDQPAFGLIRLAQEMSSASGFTPSENPIKLGGVEFTLQDLIQLIGRLFAWPYRESLEGWLHCSDQRAVVEAQLSYRRHHRKRSGSNSSAWRAVATGDGAREKAIADIAAQILVGTQRSSFTDNWQSLKAYQEGVRALRAKRGGFLSLDSIETAHRCFESALAYDPANWIARFHLALAFCHEGRPATALRHFRVLDDVLSRAVNDVGFKKLVAENELAGTGQKLGFLTIMRTRLIEGYSRIWGERELPHRSSRVMSLLQHLVDYPECPFILQYNMAIALTDLRRSSGDQEGFAARSDAVSKHPIESLQAIAAFDRDELDSSSSQDGMIPSSAVYGECERRLTPRARYELSLYAKSARAHIISMNPDAVSEPVTELRSTLAAIDATCERARCLDRKIDNWRSVQTTRAVALAALARLLALDEPLSSNLDEPPSTNREARNLFYEAIAAEPNLVDAYLQLARLYMRWRRVFADNWALRAESLLQRALELNPTCEESKIALAELYAMPAIGRLPDAIEMLRSLSSSPKAYLKLANLVIDENVGDASGNDALRYLRQYIRISWAFNTQAADCYNKLVEYYQIKSADENEDIISLIELLRQLSCDLTVSEADKLRIRSALDKLQGVARTRSQSAGS